MTVPVRKEKIKLKINTKRDGRNDTKGDVDEMVRVRC